MAYDEGLEFRVREWFDENITHTRKKMFGGVGYLIHGNMACGVLEDYLIVRVGPEQYHDCLKKKHIREFDLTGKSMSGWIVAESSGIEEDKVLWDWIKKGVNFAESLPPK